MQKSRYLRVFLDCHEMDLPNEDLPIVLNYSLEKESDFQIKESSSAYQVTLPATPNNDGFFGTVSNPVSTKLFPDEFGLPMDAMIEANGIPILTGKAFLKSAKHTDRPISYTLDFYGSNTDWKVDLEELTLHDILKDIRFTFDIPTIQDSWSFDGRDLTRPFVFAPVRFAKPMGEDDNDMPAIDLRPSLSLYYCLYQGFKLAGYRIKSSFFDTDYFRRLVMPWTWGNFLFSEGTRLDDLKFLAVSTEEFSRSGLSRTEYVDLKVSNDSISPGFDNNGTYAYDPVNFECVWTYLPAFSYGPIEAGFHLNVWIDAFVNAGSDMNLQARWFKNGGQIAETTLKSLNAPGGVANKRTFVGSVEDWKVIPVVPGDTVSVKFWLRTFDSAFGRCTVKCKVDTFETDYFRIPFGGNIDFVGYPAFKKYKWLDLLRGTIDLFNLQIQTNNQERFVLIEPTHSTKIDGDEITGYFNNDFLDWDPKQDILKDSDIELVSDNEREFTLKLKEDNNDGILKKIQDRHSTEIATAKYVFSSRFNAGKKEFKNRFFSPLMHFDAEQWQGITGIAPQLPVIVPENISNTSRDEAQNTFSPKIAWYKGNVSGVGGWVFEGDELTTFPFMFSVNYKEGGHNDPILSYTDERIGSGPGSVIGLGLLKRFFIQRFANMRNGRYYSTQFMLNNTDISNGFFREHIGCRGQRWELVRIEGYSPMSENPTKVRLRMWAPASNVDANSCYPSNDSVLRGSGFGEFDSFYQPLKALTTDIPNI
jgi:hypothetical protein